MNKSMLKTKVVNGKVSRDLIDVPKLDFSDIEKSMKKITKIVEGLSYGTMTGDSDFIDFKNEKIDNFIQTESNKIIEKLKIEIINHIKEQAKKIEDYWEKVNSKSISYYSDEDTGYTKIDLDNVKNSINDRMLENDINKRMFKGRKFLNERIAKNKQMMENYEKLFPFSSVEKDHVFLKVKKATTKKKTTKKKTTKKKVVSKKRRNNGKK